MSIMTTKRPALWIYAPVLPVIAWWALATLTARWSAVDHLADIVAIGTAITLVAVLAICAGAWAHGLRRRAGRVRLAVLALHTAWTAVLCVSLAVPRGMTTAIEVSGIARDATRGGWLMDVAVINRGVWPCTYRLASCSWGHLLEPETPLLVVEDISGCDANASADILLLPGCRVSERVRLRPGRGILGDSGAGRASYGPRDHAVILREPMTRDARLPGEEARGNRYASRRFVLVWTEADVGTLQ